MKYFILCFSLVSFYSCTDQEAVDEQEILDYLSDNNLRAEKSSDGIYYIVDEVGNGEHPNIDSTVDVDYNGYLLDGTVFDSNVGIEFGLWQVIEGWKKGIPLFSKGGSGKLLIPSHLGYGEKGSGILIPGNSVLVFDIVLNDFF